jgi:hypothetical protein
VVDAVFDRRLNAVDVEVGDEVVLGDSFYGAPDDEVRVSPDWPAPVELLPGGTRACDGLAG